MLKNKKGLTLVEVVVALGILAVVFSGTVTLVLNVTKLAMTAREKTLVTALAQRGIANIIKASTSGCNSTIPDTIPDDITTAPGYTIKVSTRGLIADESGSFTPEPTTPDFKEISSQVFLNSDPANPLYSIKQIVKIK